MTNRPPRPLTKRNRPLGRIAGRLAATVLAGPLLAGVLCGPALSLTVPVQHSGGPRVTATFVENHAGLGQYVWHAGIDLPRTDGADTVRTSGQERLYWALTAGPSQLAVQVVNDDPAIINGWWSVRLSPQPGVTRYMLDILRVRRVTTGKPIITYTVDTVLGSTLTGVGNGVVRLVEGLPTAGDSLVTGDSLAVDFAYYPVRIKQAVFRSPSGDEFRWYAHVDFIHRHVAWTSYPATNTNRFYGPFSGIPAGRDTFEIDEGVNFAEIEQVENYASEPHHLHFSTTGTFFLGASATNPLSGNRFGFTDPQNVRPIVRSLAFQHRPTATLFANDKLYGPVDIFVESRDDMGSPEALDDGDGAENTVREAGCYNAGYWVTADSSGGGTVATAGAPNMLFSGAGKDSITGADPLSAVLRDGAPFRIDQNTNYHLWCSHVGEDANRYWYTQARRTATLNDGSNGALARDNSEAKFRDGRHVVHAKARDVVGFGAARDSAVVIDNFRPYVRKLVVRDGGTEIYRGEWMLNIGNLVFSHVDPDSGMFDSAGKKRCADGGSDVTIEVTFSEGMQQAQLTSIVPLGFVPQLRRATASQDSIWEGIIPKEKLGGADKAGRQIIAITGLDWGGNALRAINSTANIYTAENMRNSAGVMQGTGGTDKLHRFGICQSIAFLIDDTASMGQEISGAKAAVVAKINELAADRTKFPRYSLISFKDRATPLATSTDPDVIRPIVEALVADGGGDCPEGSVEALEFLPGLMSRGGDAFLATDADAREGPQRLNQVNAQLVATKIKVHPIVTGNCDGPDAPGSIPARGLSAADQGGDAASSPGAGPALDMDALPTFRRVARETGGQFFYASRDDFDEAFDIALGQLEARGLLMAREDTLPTPQVRSYTIPVDDSVRVVTFIHNPGPDSASTQTLRRPGGTVVLASDPDVEVTQAATVSAWRITAPQGGNWTVEINGSGEYSIAATSETARWISLESGTGVLPGQPVPLTLDYMGDGTLTTCRLIGANGDVVAPVTLFDDGNHGDDGAGDNVYGATVTLTVPGAYRLSVDGTGSEPFTCESPQTIFLGQPEIDLDYANLNFNPTQVGEFDSQSLTIRNLGTLPLDVTSIHCADPAFEFSLDAVTLPVGGSTVVRAYFAPTEAESLGLPLTILSNDADEPERTVNLTAVSSPASEISVSADSLVAEAALGDSVDLPLTIRNTGSGALRYAILRTAESIVGAPGPPRERLEPLAAGGPDAGGYRFVDSDEVPGPPVQWVDLDTAGVMLTGLMDEEVRGPFPIGFDFSFYGQVQTTFHVGSNGFITLGSDPGATYPAGECPGGGAAPANMIAPEWLDLDPSSAGTVVYDGTPERLVVEYRWVADVSSPDARCAFQTVLHPDGTIQFNYRFVPNNPSSVARLSDPGGTEGLGIYCHEYVSPHGNLTTEIHSDIPWIQIPAAAGTVPAGDSVVVQVRLSARQAGFQAGQEHASGLLVVTNDPDEPRVPVPVSLAVRPGVRSIEGHVSSAETSDPLPGAVVTAVGFMGTFIDTADGTGTYRLDALPGDDYVVTATAPDYTASAPQAVSLPPNATLDFALGRPTITMTPGSVSRFVTNGEIACAPVTFRNAGTLPLTFETRPGEGGGSGAVTLHPTGAGNAGPPRLLSFATVLEDPAGDSSIDLLGLDAALQPTGVTFRIRMAEPLASTPIAGYLSLDLDRNPATGAFPAFGQGLPTQDIGAEVEVSLSPSCSGHVDLYDRVNPHHIGQRPATISGNTLEFTLPYALLGTEDNRMHVSALITSGSCGGGDAPTFVRLSGGLPERDWAPETGHGTVGPCPWLTLAPAADTLAAGDSLVVQLCVDATGLADTTLDCLVTVVTNDPRTPELNLPVHILVTHAGDVEEAPPAPPVREYALFQNRPNPFRPATRISFALPRTERVRLRIYDIAGRLVTTLIDATLPAGHHEAEWQARNTEHAPGLYFYRFEAGSFVATRKMLRLP